MRFLMLVCRDTEPVPDGAESGAPISDVDEWATTMDARGIRITGDPVAHQREAKAVRVRRGEIAVTDGPYLETKEILGGFDLLECRDMAEAIEVAAAHPFAREGVMELRPIREL